jgi:hypothetical protein
MIRLAPPTLAVALFASLALAVPAAAQDHATQLPAAAITIAAVQLHTAPELTAARLETPRRPNSLLPLYLSFAAFQALDVHSTLGALNRGGVEANPLMKSVTGNPASLVAIKAAGTAGVLYTSERLWKKNPAAAIVFMIGANSAMAWVVQNNYRAAR